MQQRTPKESPVQRPLPWRFALYYSPVPASLMALLLWFPYCLRELYQVSTVGVVLTSLAWLLAALMVRMGAVSITQRWGARRMLYCSLIGALAVTFLLSYPPTHYEIHGISRQITFTLVLGLPLFFTLMVALGLCLALGQAALAQQIARFYPQQRKTVSALLGLFGAVLAAALLLIATTLAERSGIWQTGFMLMFTLILLTLLRMHLAVRRAERKEWASAAESADLPELCGK